MCTDFIPGSCCNTQNFLRLQANGPAFILLWYSFLLQPHIALTIDRGAREMTIEGGALWGNVYRTLVDQEDGIFVNGGRCPSVGVSGFVLGGGIGPFSRQYGMAVDSLNEVQIVTVDGELYTLTPEDDPDSEEGRDPKIVPSYPNSRFRPGTIKTSLPVSLKLSTSQND